MICPNCGNEMNGDRCFICGYGIRNNNSQETNNSQNNQFNYQNEPSGFQNNQQNYQNNQQNPNYIYNNYNNMNNYPTDEGGFMSESDMAQKNGLSAEVKMKDWFLYELSLIGVSILSVGLSLIPFVGIIFGFLPLAFQLFMAFRKKTAKSMKNFIKTQLIISIILFVLISIITVVAFVIFGASLFSALDGLHY